MYNNYPNNNIYYNEDDRFLLAPFLLGGLAGGALGYGISNSNKQQYYPYPVYYYPTYPMYSNSNYYYY
jgi:hypothetical protein